MQIQKKTFIFAPKTYNQCKYKHLIHKTMKLQYNSIITSLAKAIDWSANAMWENDYNNPQMKEIAIANIERALANIAEAQAELGKLKQEIINNQ